MYTGWLTQGVIKAKTGVCVVAALVKEQADCTHGLLKQGHLTCGELTTQLFSATGLHWYHAVMFYSCKQSFASNLASEVSSQICPRRSDQAATTEWSGGRDTSPAWHPALGHLRVTNSDMVIGDYHVPKETP